MSPTGAPVWLTCRVSPEMLKYPLWSRWKLSKTMYLHVSLHKNPHLFSTQQGGDLTGEVSNVLMNHFVLSAKYKISIQERVIAALGVIQPSTLIMSYWCVKWTIGQLTISAVTSRTAGMSPRSSAVKAQMWCVYGLTPEAFQCPFCTFCFSYTTTAFHITSPPYTKHLTSPRCMRKHVRPWEKISWAVHGIV